MTTPTRRARPRSALLVRAALAGALALVTLPADARAQGAPRSRRAPAAAERAALDSLRARVRRIAARTGGRMGVAVVHVQRGERLSIDGHLPVFMASVVKLPLALQLLARADRGELRLDDSVTIAARDLRPGRSPIAEAHPAGGVTLAVGELVRRAVAESDNTASDALLRHSGGPARVTRELRRLGVTGVRIDRGYAAWTRDSEGLGALPPDFHWTPARDDSLTRAVPPARRAAAAARFLADRRDRATADGLAGMLARLQRGELLRPESRAFLLRAMSGGGNPPTRIVAGVPAGTPVAHKTGSWGGWGGVRAALNDVGLVALPDGGGDLAIAVLVGGATAPVAEVERAIADATRAVYAHWTGGAGRAAAVRLAPDVLVRPLAPGLWLHETTSPDGIAANGVLLETPDGGSVLFDTGWSDAHAEALLRWAADGLRRPVRRAVVTHAHADRLGGLGALRARGVPAAALALTAERARAGGLRADVPPPDSVPGLAAGAVRDAAGYELRFPGAGHAPDNVAVWFPRQRALFGGCLVKADTATAVGNVADADLAAWPDAVARLRAAYPDVRIVVPGHGAPGGPAALAWTERLVRARGAAAR